MTSESFFTLSERIDEVFFFIGASVLLIEVLEAIFKGNLRKKTLMEMLASASTQIPFLLVEIFVMTFAYGVLYMVSANFVSWQIPTTWVTVIVALVLVDLTYYWEHRIAHQVRLLWTQHAVHHSSRDYNIITSIRFGPFESLWALIMHIPLVLIGFAPDVVFGCSLIVLGYQTWLHTEVIGKLGPLEWVLNTPSHHRVHHGADAKYLDKNYGGILIIWDRMFGSFQVEEERPRYGLTTDFDSQNPIKVWFSELPALMKDLRNAKSGQEVWMRLFGRPGWKP